MQVKLCVAVGRVKFSHMYFQKERRAENNAMISDLKIQNYQTDRKAFI